MASGCSVRTVRRAVQSPVGQLLEGVFNDTRTYNKYFFFTGPKPSASHALVDFGDEGTTIIPFARIVDGSMNNGRCCVKWPDGKEYDATLVFTGTVGKIFYGLLEVILFCTFC